MAIALDGSTPVRWAGTPAGGGTIVSASFTAPTDAYLVLDVESDGTSGQMPNTPTVSDSGGLTWTKRVERSYGETTDGGYSAFWTARTTNSVSRTITVTSGVSNQTKRHSAKLRVFTGVDVDGTPVDTVGANNEGGSGTNNLTTATITAGAAGVLVCADCDFNQLGAFQSSSDLTQDTADYAGEISVCSGYKTVSSGASVNGNLNAGGTGTAQHKWCQIIVREAAGGGGTTAPRMLSLLGVGR